MDYLLDLILIPMCNNRNLYGLLFRTAVIGIEVSEFIKNYTPKNSFAIVVCAHNEERL